MGVQWTTFWVGYAWAAGVMFICTFLPNAENIYVTAAAAVVTGLVMALIHSVKKQETQETQGMEWNLNELKNAVWSEHAIDRIAQRQKPGTALTIDDICKDAIPYGVGMGGVHIWAAGCGLFPVVDHRRAKPRVLTVLTKGIANKTINNQQLLCMKPFREALHKISIGCDDPMRVAREALGIRLARGES